MRIAPSASAPVSGRVMPTLTTLSAAPVREATAPPANTARAATASVGQPPSFLRCDMITSPSGLWRRGLPRFFNSGQSRAGNRPAQAAAGAKCPFAGKRCSDAAGGGSARSLWLRRDCRRRSGGACGGKYGRNLVVGGRQILAPDRIGPERRDEGAVRRKVV